MTRYDLPFRIRTNNIVRFEYDEVHSIVIRNRINQVALPASVKGLPDEKEEIWNSQILIIENQVKGELLQGYTTEKPLAVFPDTRIHTELVQRFLRAYFYVGGDYVRQDYRILNEQLLSDWLRTLTISEKSASQLDDNDIDSIANLETQDPFWLPMTAASAPISVSQLDNIAPLLQEKGLSAILEIECWIEILNNTGISKVATILLLANIEYYVNCLIENAMTQSTSLQDEQRKRLEDLVIGSMNLKMRVEFVSDTFMESRLHLSASEIGALERIVKFRNNLLHGKRDRGSGELKSKIVDYKGFNNDYWIVYAIRGKFREALHLPNPLREDTAHSHRKRKGK